MTMYTTNNSSTYTHAHYISASSYNTIFLLNLDLERAVEDISSSSRLLLTTPFVVGQGEYIRPIVCDQTVDTSNKIKYVATIMSGKLISIDKLQALSNVTYYKLLMHLYSASDKSRKLSELIEQFRSICMESTSQRRKIFATVQKEIIVVTRICEQIEVETEELLDMLLLNTK